MECSEWLGLIRGDRGSVKFDGKRCGLWSEGCGLMELVVGELGRLRRLGEVMGWLAIRVRVRVKGDGMA